MRKIDDDVKGMSRSELRQEVMRLRSAFRTESIIPAIAVVGLIFSRRFLKGKSLMPFRYPEKSSLKIAPYILIVTAHEHDGLKHCFKPFFFYLEPFYT